MELKRGNATKIHFLLLFALAIIIPSGYYVLEGPLVALLFINWVFFIQGFRKIREINLPSVLLMAFFGIILLGVFYAENTSAQFNVVGRNISFILIPLSFVGVEIDKRDLNRIKACFLFSAIAFILIANLYSIVDFLTTGEKEIFLEPSIYNKFTYYGLTRIYYDWHPTSVSTFLNLGVVFCYELYYKRKSYLIWALLSTFLILNIFLLSSFIGIGILLLLLMLFLLSFYRTHKTSVTAIFLVLLIAFPLFFIINPFNYPKITKIKKTEWIITDKKEEANMITQRLALWKTSIDVFKKQPWIGVSNAQQKDEMHAQFIKNEFLDSAEYRYSSHNQYLYTLSSSGIIGLLVLLGVLIYPFFFYNASGTFKVFLLLSAMTFLTEDVLTRQQGMVFFVFFYALLSQKIKDKPEKPKELENFSEIKS